ncbi:hypothetical protein GCM10010937_08660 [Gluconobacter japonicus]|uniref:Uncharacterized protein n=1 Tax=Gluconobacter japonicus TaxID=376620 RepID=A0ABQ5WH88_GLUJA|nr:hypothetical protein GCM10010937_08660 [Gluconobacter japonicus]
MEISQPSLCGSFGTASSDIGCPDQMFRMHFLEGVEDDSHLGEVGGGPDHPLAVAGVCFPFDCYQAAALFCLYQEVGHIYDLALYRCPTLCHHFHKMEPPDSRLYKSVRYRQWNSEQA